ncbi:MAG: RNA polymerase sigma factor [Oscillospiraceae bacterium]
MEDEKILLLLRNNPETGLWELGKKYTALATAVIGRILVGRSQDIEECVADTFIRIWKNANEVVTQNESIKGYVICAARSIAIDRYRKLKKEQGNMELEDYMPDDKNLADTVEGSAGVAAIQREIMALPQPDREIFLRRYFLYQSIKEISAVMNIGEKAVESRLFRGRKKLKIQMEESGVLA